nr:gag pol polyprotein [Hymenolepis microstoma]
MVSSHRFPSRPCAREKPMNCLKTTGSSEHRSSLGGSVMAYPVFGFYYLCLDAENCGKLRQDTRERIDSRKGDIQASRVHRHTRSSLACFSFPEARFRHIYVDVVGLLPPSNSFTYVPTNIDHFTLWPTAVSLRKYCKGRSGMLSSGTRIQHNHKALWRNVCSLPRLKPPGSIVVFRRHKRAFQIHPSSVHPFECQAHTYSKTFIFMPLHFRPSGYSEETTTAAVKTGLSGVFSYAGAHGRIHLHRPTTQTAEVAVPPSPSPPSPPPPSLQSSPEDASTL